MECVFEDDASGSRPAHVSWLGLPSGWQPTPRYHLFTVVPPAPLLNRGVANQTP